VPCVTLRENTERPETLEVGANILAGNNPDNILKMVEKMIKSPRKWENPFGEGGSSEEILNIILK
jgi:UDP-N-acetylglucosamine 2-epimerase (non-hydrolysing)